MPAFNDLSIKRKLTLIMMLIGIIALVLSCASFIIYDQIFSRRAMVQDLRRLAEIIGSNSTAANLMRNSWLDCNSASPASVERTWKGINLASGAQR